MRQRHLFVPFTKVDEEKREVSGRMTQEMIDRDGEIWDYAASVPHIKAWSKSFDDATDGKSLGNVRAMHRAISAGKVINIDFNDADQAVDIVTKIVDDAEWEKVKEGIYTGFSQGGNVVRSWRDPSNTKHKRFEVKPSEVSLADFPCVPTATFSYVKLGGATETRRFKKITDPAAAKPVDYADVAGNKLPIFTKTMVRASLALWGQESIRAPYDAKAQETIGRHLREAAQSHGIATVTEKAMLRGDFAKGLYDVSQLASVVQSLAWLQTSARYERDSEGDESTVPDQLCDAVADLLSVLETMIGEEGDELLASLGHISSTTNATEGTMADADKIAAADATIEKVAVADDFVKVSKKAIAKVAEIHAHMTAVHKMMGEGVDKIAGFIGEAGGQAKKIATGADVDDAGAVIEKVAKSEFEKVTGERNDFEKRLGEATEKIATLQLERDGFEKTAGDLAEGVTALTTALEVRKGALRVVDKATDGQAALAATAVVEKTAAADSTKVVADGEVDRGALHTSFKKSFQKPSIQGGVPA
jgi:hypothetical protein